MSVTICLNYYKDSSPERQRELDQCVFRNCNAATVMAVTDLPQHRLPTHPNIHWIVQPSRPTFDELFSLVLPGPDDVTIVTNTDVYFDPSGIAAIERRLKAHQSYALTRWEVNGDGTAALRSDGLASMGQDAWAFRGPIRPIGANFSPGRPGCDNRLAQLLIDAGYEVTNPANTIKAYHLHLTNVRHYVATDPAQRLLGMYAEVPVSDGDITAISRGYLAIT